MRGILGGGFVGLVVGGVAVAGLSLVSTPPDRAAPEAAAMRDDTSATSDAATDVTVSELPEITPPSSPSNAPTVPSREEPVIAEAAPDTIPAPSDDTAPSVMTAPAAAQDRIAVEIVDDAAPDGETPEPAETDSVETADNADPEAEVVEQEAEETEAAAEAGTADAALADDTAPDRDVAAAIEAPAAPEETDADVNVAASDVAPETGDAPVQVEASVAESEPLTDAATAPPEQPQIAATDALDTPPATGNDALIEATADAPVLPSPRASAPAAPVPDVLALAETESVGVPDNLTETQPTAPIVDETVSADQVAPEVPSGADRTPLTPTSPTSPAPPAAGDTVPAQDAATPEIVLVEDVPTVSVLPSGASSVRVNRLINTSDDDSVEAPEADEAVSESIPDDAPAVVRYAIPSENPADLPEISVVLVDDPDFSGAVAAVAGLPFPVSVMLNPSAPDVRDRMTAYRAAGVEVGLIANLPPAATASDAAIYFEAAFANLPETFAVLDAAGAIQGGSDVIRQTVAALVEDGHGLITVPRGLNSAARIASENGIPSALIYRDLDAEDQDARVIGRFIDQAAFRAGQNPGIVLMGRVRAETLSALYDWGNASRADQVAMMPVSAILSTDD